MQPDRRERRALAMNSNAPARQISRALPMLLLVGGPAGAGKSTLARAWCAAPARAAHVQLDEVRHLIVAGTVTWLITASSTLRCPHELAATHKSDSVVPLPTPQRS